MMNLLYKVWDIPHSKGRKCKSGTLLLGRSSNFGASCSESRAACTKSAGPA